MATIKAIEGRSVHQIQSGQVIVDLNSAVKELVENSLDAGASSIEVRFKNQGLESIEVQDNGKGISPDDYETIALKHYTSKLSSYEDLTSLDTFGFRGEALSSLCALSRFHIVTARAEDGAVGRRLDFEVSGKLKSSTVTSAQKGTTVAVEDLFCNLPVRRKEIEKNIKREYGKVIGLLHAYACISVGVRFSISNHMPKGKKALVFSTKSNSTTKENIVNVFGAKTLLALIKLDLHLEMQLNNGPSTQGARNWSTQATDRSMEVVVQGHISKPVFGEGRQAPDRQMFFVNSRPCALPQVSKAVNEVYKSFNVTQSPFIFANLIMDTNSYDVNVSPDKRTIMLHDQTALLERLKAALTELFEQTDHTVPQSTLPNRKLPAYQPLTVQRQASGQLGPIRRSAAHNDSEESEREAEHHEEAGHARRSSERSVRNGSQPSLIQDWVGRDTELRKAKSMPTKPRKLSNEESRALYVAHNEHISSGDVDRTTDVGLAADINRHDEVTDRKPDSHSPPTNGDQSVSRSLPLQAEAPLPDPLSTPYDDLFSQRPVWAAKAREQTDTNMPPPSTTKKPVTSFHGEAIQASEMQRALTKTEAPIPSFTPASQRSAPGPVANAFDRMRPKRTPLQTAEITVGDTTTTTVIGSSPPYKRRRVHKPDNSQAIAEFCGSPLATRGLHNFAAPGSQMQLDSSHVPISRTESREESDEEQDPEPADSESEPEQDSGSVADVEALISDPLDALLPAPVDDDQYDEDYIDEEEKRIKEDEKVARMIQEAENAAAKPTEDNMRRATQVLKNGGNRKEATLQLMSMVNTSVTNIRKSCEMSQTNERTFDIHVNTVIKGELDDSNAESKLSLTVSKADFARMSVIGQFNLGFILAVRHASTSTDEDELFIVDQHAADEKYNYERFQRTVTLQSQRLVRPMPLELTAIDEEIILNNASALKANGFEVEITSPTDDDESNIDPNNEDETPYSAERRPFRLLTLPISGTKTFTLSDFEELLHLLSEAPAGSSEIPRPRKVQKMLAMRACRSSIMVGKTLTGPQMQKVVRHMGEMEKPWNCPHGRPTMRHLAGLGAWRGWGEGEWEDNDGEGVGGAGGGGGRTDWKAWLQSRKRKGE